MTSTPPRKRGRPRKHPLPGSTEQETPVDPRTEFQSLDGSAPLIPVTEDFPSALQSTPSTWLDKLHLDSRVTTLRIVAMLQHYRQLRVEERTVGQIMAHAGLYAEKHKGYELIPALVALIEYYKRHAEKTHKAGDHDKDRKKKAEADIAELKTLELAGEVVPLTAAKQFWSDARLELRKVIELAGYLTKEQKKELLGDFVRLKTKLVLLGETGE